MCQVQRDAKNEFNISIITDDGSTPRGNATKPENKRDKGISSKNISQVIRF
ncbi:hypothetical protein J6590_088982 [Homalodisca vitripennis]|nr:hypothetical protein J6590_088982 [Homalodisca vitripennis]